MSVDGVDRETLIEKRCTGLSSSFDSSQLIAEMEESTRIIGRGTVRAARFSNTSSRESATCIINRSEIFRTTDHRQLIELLIAFRFIIERRLIFSGPAFVIEPRV